MSVSVCEKHGVLGCGDCELEALREVIARREAVIRILEDDVLREKRRADEMAARIVEIYKIAGRGEAEAYEAKREVCRRDDLSERSDLALQAAHRHYAHIKELSCFEFEALRKKR